MANISVSLPADGETIDAADYNTPINTIVNDYNGGIDNSNIASGAAISGSKIADTSITNAKLATGAGEPGGAWTTWTPTLSGRFTDGDWTKTGKYTQIGKTVHAKLTLVATDATPMAGGSGEMTLTLPVTSVAPSGTGNVPQLGTAVLFDANPGSLLPALVGHSNTTTALIRPINAASTYATLVTNVSSTVPFTWTTNDEISLDITYEAA